MAAAVMAQVLLNGNTLSGIWSSVSSGGPGATPILANATTVGIAEQQLDPDTGLVERCLRGEQASWEELLKTHTRRVYAICYRFTNKESEAQDLTQEVFLRIFKTL